MHLCRDLCVYYSFVDDVKFKSAFRFLIYEKSDMRSIKSKGDLFYKHFDTVFIVLLEAERKISEQSRLFGLKLCKLTQK